jgi:polyvinyl alcohol dehydrogenase (cytochrome)
MTPDRIFAALKSPTHTEGQALSDIQKQRIGEFMGGRPMGSVNAGEAKAMAGQCTANPPLTDPAASPGWNGWSPDLANTRFQPAAAARLTAAQVPNLKLKWAFGIPHGMTNNAQPTVVSGRVFMATDNGYIYSIDAKTGCVYWSFQNGSIVRNSPMVGAVTGQGAARWAVFFGDGHANVFALDAQTGRQLWKVRVDDHVVARITASVRYHDGRLYVPISGSEEFTAGHQDYPCCTARGGVAALDASPSRRAPAPRWPRAGRLRRRCRCGSCDPAARARSTRDRRRPGPRSAAPRPPAPGSCAGCAAPRSRAPAVRRLRSARHAPVRRPSADGP